MYPKIQNPNPSHGLSKISIGHVVQNLLAPFLLFLLAFLPRAYDLYRFVTADEAKWVYRSAQFLAALLRHDYPATSVNLTPAVTTTWLGSLGLAVYYWLNQATISMPFTDWLTSLPEFRVELDILVATRWPMVIFTSLSLVAFFLLLRRLLNPNLAFLAVAFIALDPHLVALSRIIGHDAPTMVFMSFSLVLLLLIKPAGAQGCRGAGESNQSIFQPSLILSALAAGLAFLSKAPAFFLIPFAVLILILVETHFFRQIPRLVTSALPRLLIWLAVAYLTFIAFWPAAWVEPVGRPLAVFQNAFISATDEEEASEEGFWRVPDLGPAYYLVNGAFKLSPLVMVGTVLALFFLIKQRVNEKDKIPSASVLWLLVFVVLFTLFMTVSDKRSPRYILPVFPPLAIIAAYGWLELARVAGSKVAEEQRSRGVGEQGSRPCPELRPEPDEGGAGEQGDEEKLSLHGSTTHYEPVRSLPLKRTTSFILTTVLLFAALTILLPYAPYYFTYFNPLLGGPFTAPALVKIGWGEGLDQVGRFLQREDHFRDSRVGTAYASTVAPFFEGDLSKPTESNLDYIVLYLKQVQAGDPSPLFIRYFEQMPALFSVDLNGLHYADVYPGPALQILPSDPQPPNPYPIAFRPLTPYGRIGEALEVDVVWPSTATLPPTPVLGLATPADVAAGGKGESEPIPTLAQAAGQLTHPTTDLMISHHSLLLPADLSQGTYILLINNLPLGEIELRHFQAPTEMNPAADILFGQQIALVGYQFEPTTDYLGVTIAWQAQTSSLPDYTVFAQILEAETNERLAGVDTPPLKGEWPTSRWVKGEVVTDEYLVAIPPGFPPGYYKVIVGLYSPETGQRLTLADGQDHWLLPWTFIRK